MISDLEKRIFLSLFNRGGYVLDFSTADFDRFTDSSVGVALCSRYGLSKGKSLIEFCNEAEENEVLKLFSDLIEYYETFCINNNLEKKYISIYEKCKEILSREKKNGVIIETPSIISVNREYISDISRRAIKDIENGDFDSSITKSRTLLEEVFCFAIEKHGDTPVNNGRIKDLYNQVKTIYPLRQTSQQDKRINELLSGLEKILNAISEMRNEASDSHGVGSSRIEIEEYHARLFVNASIVMSDYILSVVNHNDKSSLSHNH